MASNSKDDGDEAEWEDQLIWYPSAKRREQAWYPFTENELPRFFEDYDSNPSNPKASEEFVRNIYYFRTPLAHALATAVVGKMACHDYIIIGTSMNRFFCFSKTASHIEILCAGDIEDIHDSQYQGVGVFRAVREGREEKDPLDISHNNHTIADIVEWIFQSGEITKGYSVLTRNCRHFAYGIYTKFAAPYCPFSSPDDLLLNLDA